MRPLICTSNTYGHIDYEVPLHARKSTDYRTSTGTYHRQIPCVPQEFDCVSKGCTLFKIITTNYCKIRCSLIYNNHYFLLSSVSKLESKTSY